MNIALRWMVSPKQSLYKAQLTPIIIPTIIMLLYGQLAAGSHMYVLILFLGNELTGLGNRCSKNVIRGTYICDWLADLVRRINKDRSSNQLWVRPLASRFRITR
jgi:hypothetical protein